MRNNFKKAFGLGSKYSLKSETFEKYLKGYFKGNLGEGTSELFASVMQNGLDRIALGDENVSIMDGTNEAFWSGFFMSGLGFRAPALAATAYRAATTRDNYQEINNNTNQGEFRKNHFVPSSQVRMTTPQGIRPLPPWPKLCR